MGLLDSILGAALGGGGQGAAPSGNAALLNAVLGMLAGGGGGGAGGGAGGVLGSVLGSALGGGQAGGQGGGLPGLGQLAEQFQRGGLGDVLGSWVSTGQNLPISPDQLGSVLGSDKIAGMASQLGMNQGDLLGQLSQMLPEVVDKLTPNGQMPQTADLGNLGQLGGLLAGMLGKR